MGKGWCGPLVPVFRVVCRPLSSPTLQRYKDILYFGVSDSAGQGATHTSLQNLPIAAVLSSNPFERGLADGQPPETRNGSDTETNVTKRLHYARSAPAKPGL